MMDLNTTPRELLKAEEILRSNNIWAEVEHSHTDRTVIVTILWGDWKHDHARARYLLEQDGFEEYSSMVTEEDGSDCYSAVHFFKY